LTPLPAFHDDLEACRAEAWRLLGEGARRNRAGFHTPALATVDGQGRPRVRTVVLREADPEASALRFHCDRRSDKAAEIAATGFAALHGYDAASKVQIRASGPARLHTDDIVADAAWAGSLAMSRVCYGTAPAPGAIITSGDAYSLPTEDEAVAAGRENFAAVLVAVETLEFLYLDRRGHRRARWTREEAGWIGAWLVP
jgi:hypothetical protein